MIASGFSNAPVSRALLIGVILLAVAATVTDNKYYLWIEIKPHLLEYDQYWRLLTWPIAYTNSTEVLFAAMTVYQLRVIERLWGSRKFLSFILATLPYIALIPPLLLALIIRPLSFGRINYLPAGPTGVIFALLAQYHAAIPYLYKYQLSTTVPGAQDEREYGMLLTSKATSYILPMQLALSQLPGSAIVAAVGWIVGLAYRRDILPGISRWRVPSWIMGGTGQKERYNTLQRRMEGEAGRATGVEIDTNNVRRRGMFNGLMDQFRTA